MADHAIVILVEEKSSAIVIQELVNRLNLASRVRILKHDGLGDLQNSIPRKFAAEPSTETRFIILCDSDGQDCIKRKELLRNLVPKAMRPRTTIRIACEELEAWYLAQPNALARAGVLKKRIPNKFQSNNPDNIRQPKEHLRRLAHDLGQIAMARKIGPHLNCDDRRSKSYFHFLSALHNAAKQQE
jgi:Domain of unknown function (DUF4276)